MSRMDALMDNPLRTLGVLALVLVAVGIAVGSGANFTAQSANPSNTFTSGSLEMVNSKDAAAILTASNMVPSDVATGTVDIENSGTVSGDFSLSRPALTDPGLLGTQLDVVVTDCGDFSAGTPVCEGTDPTEYTGTLAAMSGSYPLATFAAGDKHRYEFEVTFNASADDTYEGATSTATFQWDAVAN